MKIRDFLSVFKKLGMEVKDGSNHTIAKLWYKEQLVVYTMIPKGKGELSGILRHLVRQQMYLNEKELRGLAICTHDLEDYRKILELKGKI